MIEIMFSINVFSYIWDLSKFRNIYLYVGNIITGQKIIKTYKTRDDFEQSEKVSFPGFGPASTEIRKYYQSDFFSFSNHILSVGIKSGFSAPLIRRISHFSNLLNDYCDTEMLNS